MLVLVLITLALMLFGGMFYQWRKDVLAQIKDLKQKLATARMKSFAVQPGYWFNYPWGEGNKGYFEPEAKVNLRDKLGIGRAVYGPLGLGFYDRVSDIVREALKRLDEN